MAVINTDELLNKAKGFKVTSDNVRVNEDDYEKYEEALKALKDIPENVKTASDGRMVPADSLQTYEDALAFTSKAPIETAIAKNGEEVIKTELDRYEALCVLDPDITKTNEEQLANEFSEDTSKEISDEEVSNISEEDFNEINNIIKEEIAKGPAFTENEVQEPVAAPVEAPVIPETVPENIAEEPVVTSIDTPVVETPEVALQEPVVASVEAPVASPEITIPEAPELTMPTIDIPNNENNIQLESTPMEAPANFATDDSNDEFLISKGFMPETINQMPADQKSQLVEQYKQAEQSAVNMQRVR